MERTNYITLQIYLDGVFTMFINQFTRFLQSKKFTDELVTFSL